MFRKVIFFNRGRLWGCLSGIQEDSHVVTIDDYEDVPYNDEDALLKAVASQPVSVAIEGGGRDFQLYSTVKTIS